MYLLYNRFYLFSSNNYFYVAGVRCRHAEGKIARKKKIEKAVRNLKLED